MAWRGTGALPQARAEGRRALELLTGFDVESRHFAQVAEERLDVDIPMPTQEDLRRLVRRLGWRLQIVECNRGLTMAQRLCAAPPPFFSVVAPQPPKAGGGERRGAGVPGARVCMGAGGDHGAEKPCKPR
jgi:hypothetical protein